MKSLLRFGVVASLVACASPLNAQPTTDAAVVLRLVGARRAIPTGPGHVRETPGILVVDPALNQIRLDAEGTPLFDIPRDRVVALHYEKTKFPQRFLRRASFYVVIHYDDSSGTPAAQTIRLLREQDALTAIAALEAHTGQRVDRSEDGESFLGIPIRATAGARVAVTDRTGVTVRGRISTLSPSSLTLTALDDGAQMTFAQYSVRRIRILYSPRHDALVGLIVGASSGIWGTYMAAAVSGCFSETGHTSDCHVGTVMIGAAGIVGGVGALIATTIGSVRYPFNRAFDVYRSREPGAHAFTVAVAPHIAASGTALNVSFRF